MESKSKAGKQTNKQTLFFSPRREHLTHTHTHTGFSFTLVFNFGGSQRREEVVRKPRGCEGTSNMGFAARKMIRNGGKKPLIPFLFYLFYFIYLFSCLSLVLCSSVLFVGLFFFTLCNTFQFQSISISFSKISCRDLDAQSISCQQFASLLFQLFQSYFPSFLFYIYIYICLVYM